MDKYGGHNLPVVLQDSEQSDKYSMLQTGEKFQKLFSEKLEG